MYAKTLTLGIDGGEMFPECGINPRTGIETAVIQQDRSQYVTSFNVRAFTSLHEVLPALTRYKGIVGNVEGTDKGVLTRLARSVDGITTDTHLEKYHSVLRQAETYYGRLSTYVIDMATKEDLEEIAKKLCAEPTKEGILEKLYSLSEGSKKTCEAIQACNLLGISGKSIDGDGLRPQIGRIKQEYKDLRTVAIAAVNNREYAIEPHKASVLRTLFTRYIDSLEILETHLVKLGYPELEEYIRESAPQISEVVAEIYSLDNSFGGVLKTLSGVIIKETPLGAVIECTVASGGQTFGKSKQKQTGTTMLAELSSDSKVLPPEDVVEIYMAIKEEADDINEKLMAEGLISNTYGIATGNE